MTPTRVSVGDSWAADDGSAADARGCVWIVSDIDGWFDSPPVVAGPISRPGADGVWDGLPTQGARAVAVSGTVIAPSGALLLDALDRVSGLLAESRRYDTLVVDEGPRSLARQAAVRLGGPTLTKILNATSASWSLSLFAPDPKRYSADLHSVSVAPFAPGAGRSYDLSYPRAYGPLGTSGLVKVVNAGTRDTPVRFVVPPQTTNPLIRLAGAESMQVMITTPLGLDLVIDTGERSVLLGGVSRRQLMSRDDFFLLPPGESTVYYATDAGTAPMAVEWRDAW